MSKSADLIVPLSSSPREKEGGGGPAARRGRTDADELDKHLEWIENTDNGAAIEERRNEMFPFLRLLIHLFRSTTFNPHCVTMAAPVITCGWGRPIAYYFRAFGELNREGGGVSLKWLTTVVQVV